MSVILKEYKDINNNSYTLYSNVELEFYGAYFEVIDAFITSNINLIEQGLELDKIVDYLNKFVSGNGMRGNILSMSVNVDHSPTSPV